MRAQIGRQEERWGEEGSHSSPPLAKMHSASVGPAATERGVCVLGVGVGARGWKMQGCKRHYINVQRTSGYN